MELRNPMKGIGFGWSLTGYARRRRIRTPLSCIVPARRAVGNQGSTVSFENSFKEIIIWLPHAISKRKLYPCFSLDLISKKKIVAQPGCCCFSSPPLSRLGQAGLRVATVLVSEPGCEQLSGQY